MKLDIGAGTNPTPGYVAIDKYQPCDARALMWELPFASFSIEEIYSCHALEHVMHRYVRIVLDEWWRVLKWHGKLILRVPDFEWCVNEWLSHKGDSLWDLAHIFGSQEHEGNVHRTAFTKDGLTSTLNNARFTILNYSVIDACKQPTMEFRCIKL